jgi:hypothetical protein
MMLARIEPHTPGYDMRTFECAACDHSESAVVHFGGIGNHDAHGPASVAAGHSARPLSERCQSRGPRIVRARRRNDARRGLRDGASPIVPARYRECASRNQDHELGQHQDNYHRRHDDHRRNPRPRPPRRRPRPRSANGSLPDAKVRRGAGALGFAIIASTIMILHPSGATCRCPPTVAPLESRKSRHD